MSVFGGKPALWDYMKDVATNLIRQKQGFKYSQNSKSFTQTLKIYGRRHMCDLFSLNFAGPIYSFVKHENTKAVQFLIGEYCDVFRAIAKIYRKAMLQHNVHGPVLVSLAEDKIKVKAQISLEQRWDSLMGFCGPKSEHKMCLQLPGESGCW